MICPVKCDRYVDIGNPYTLQNENIYDPAIRNYIDARKRLPPLKRSDPNTLSIFKYDRLKNSASVPCLKNYNTKLIKNSKKIDRPPVTFINPLSCICKPAAIYPQYIIRVRNSAGYSMNGRFCPGHDKINQDAYLAIERLNNKVDSFLFALLDGHGINGHHAAQFVKSQFPLNLEWANAKSNHEICANNLIVKEVSTTKIRMYVINAIDKTNQDLLLSNINTTLSGTTLLTVIISGEYFLCANVGDSRAVIGSMTEHGYWTERAISNDHKPDSPNEYERIITCNGRIEAYVDRFGTCIGPNRIWKMNEDEPGLTMSRSLGDKIGKEIGIVSTPEIIEGTLHRDDKLVILASDGVWDRVTNLTAVERAGTYWDSGRPEEAAKELVTQARKRWEIDPQEEIDNITAVIIFLK